MINIQNTLKRGYIVLDNIKTTPTEASINIFVKIVSFLERRNYILTEELSSHLVESNEKILTKIYKEIRKSVILPKGNFLRPVFATKDLSDENFSYEDAIRQLYVYSETYGIDIALPKIIEKEREVSLKSVTIDEKIKLNNLLKTVDIKTISEFKKDLEDIIFLPIVFGDEQITLLEDAHDNELLMDLLDSNIKVKENLFSILKIIGSHNISKLDLFKTANDVLRYALFVSEQNWRGMELYDKFRVSTAERKIIMSGLNSIDTEFAYNDMKPRKSLWLRLGINIHPKSSKYNKFVNSQLLFSYLRDGNVPFKTHNQIKHTFIEKKDYKGLFNHLKVNSGYLVRNLFMLIRNSSDEDFKFIANELSSVKMNMKLVMQIKSLLIFQMKNDIENRRFKIKGKLIDVDDNPLKKIDAERGSVIISIFDTIIKRELKGKTLISGQKVFIDEALKKYIVPTEIRDLSVSSSGIIYTPGTRIPLPEDIEYIRLFTAWGGREKDLSFDIDLSASFVRGNDVEEVAFYNQSGSLAQHSGDFTSCVKWNEKEVTAEYIDIDYVKAIEEGVDYMMTSQFIFGSGGATDDYNTDINCYSGVQLLGDRRTEKSKRIDISEAFLKIKLAGEYQSHLPLAIDFKRKEIVIMDKYSQERSGGGAYAIRKNLDMFNKEYFNALDFKTNMFNLLSVYLDANDIEIVDSIDKADTVIGYNDIVLKDKEFFNISNNLEKIVGLLN